MQKRTALQLGIGVVVLLAIGLIIYFAFPKIWGDILFPLKYEEYIIKYSQEYNLDPNLVAGVIYTESHYNKDAVSRVGARGLMQIMPATGGSIAKRIGDESYNPDKLFDPETNIRYGCWYLKYLMDNYNNEVNAVLAGYNGGGAVADRYLVTREAGIPHETRGFIKTVNFAIDMYARLYGNILTGEDITEKLKVQKEEEPTFIEKMIDYFKETIGGE